MHPAIPLAHKFLSEHTQTLACTVERHLQLSHGMKLARLVRDVVSETTTAITVKQIESILQLTKQTHDAFEENLRHYERQQEEGRADWRKAAADPLLRVEIAGQMSNIDDQIRNVRRDMDDLSRFSAKLIAICGQAGLQFAHNLILPLAHGSQI